MGILDGIGEAAEGALDTVKQGVGEATNFVTDKTADGLNAVGAEGAAEGVRDFGEGVNNRLGGTVEERRLGESDDPKELVHGSAPALEERARHLLDFAKAFESVGGGMRNLTGHGWQGEAADAFRAKFDMHPKQWLKAADACEEAGKALQAYADSVVWAQAQAGIAIGMYRDAQRATEQAASAYDARVETYNRAVADYNLMALRGGDPGSKPTDPGDFTDPGVGGRQEAQEILDDARRQRTDAARDAQRKVAAGLALAPTKPDFTDRLTADLKDGAVGMHLNAAHVGGGVVNGVADMVRLARTVNPMDPYNLTHPGQYMGASSMVLAGLVGTAAHPERLPKAMIGTGWGSDPGNALGVLLSNAVGGKGVGGAAKSAVRASAKEAVTGAARSGVRTSIRDVARKTWCKTFGGDPIDMATGRMALPQTDAALPGRLPLRFSRQFESSYRAGRWFGPSWASTADQRLEIDAEGVILIGEDNSLIPFPHPAPGVPVLPLAGERHLLSIDTHGDYTLTDPVAGRVWYFAGPGGDGDGIARLEQTADRSGQWMAFGYDSEGAPTEIAHSAGYRLKLTTDGGRITALHLAGDDGPDGDGQDIELVRYAYDDRGHLSSMTNSSGLPTRFTNDGLGRITAWTDTNGSSYEYVYDDQHRCTYQTGQDGHLRNTFTYDGIDSATGLHVTARTDSLGHTTRYLIDERLMVAGEITPDGATTRTTYDDGNRPLTVTDPLGRTTSCAYDPAGRPLMIVRPDGRYTSIGYDDQGLPASVVGADGSRTHQQFDEWGNRTSVTDGTGATTLFTYDDRGHLTSVTDALGATTSVRCDTAGLPLRITDPLGAVTSYERDAFGRPVTVTDPLGAVTRLEWTVEGRLSRRTAPDGTVESWTYDGEGNCTSHTDAMGALSRFEYTHFDLMSARTGPDGVRYEFEHDTELRLRKVTNPQGLTWSYTYDPAGRLISETDFDDRVLAYRHDAAGQLSSRTTASGEVISFERDMLGRTVAKDVAGVVTAYAYDETGGLARATSPDADLTLVRDEAGRVVAETVNSRTLTYTYDRLGRRTGRVTPTGAASTWTYDAAGNRTRLTTSGRTIAFAHDDAGRETSRHIGDTLAFTNTYDPLGRLTKQELFGPTQQPIQHRTYTYRADGNLIGLDDHLNLNSSRRFDLDTAGRVTAVHAARWSETYAYDEAGNQTSATWPTSHPGQEATGPRTYAGTRIRTAGAVRYEHDAAGRVTLRQKPRLSCKPDTWRYEWDPEDRLISATTPDGTLWRYQYDALGRRIAKQRLADDRQTVVEQVTFTWDGTTLCEQTTESADLPNPVSLTWDHQGLHPLAQTERILSADTPQEAIDDRFFAIVTDLVGTPTQLIDESGNPAWRTRSTLWGTTTWAKSSTTYTPLRFPGQYFDPETGLHYNYFRHYDPETARYLSPDPLGLEPDPNPAAYVHNPHTWTDHLGLSACPPEDGATQSIWKAPQRGQGDFQEHYGYLKENFPGGPDDPYLNGLVYFAKERTIPDTKYAPFYGEGVIEIRIPKSEYEALFARYEKPYEGGPEIELEIPNTIVEELNKYPRERHR
ncbi:putative T7SS-secreted protein [Streptomyces sp. SCSIO 30461]|uniref:putative T7SS-secreted protein n=1 Tax=Streptomyces sp. SCSIO 30461 TaxID=3118085 RepID=UPI0030D2E04E